jgi:hypothetical protein
MAALDQHWARVASGIVQEVWHDVDVSQIAGFDPNNEFLPIPGSYWIECPDNVQPNWTYDGTTFAPPAAFDPMANPPPACTKRQVLLGIKNEANKLESDVDALIVAQFPGNYKMAIHWDYPDRNLFVYDEPLVKAMATAGFFGSKTAAQVFWEVGQDHDEGTTNQLAVMAAQTLATMAQYQK